MEDSHCSHDLLLLSMACAAVIVNGRSPLFPTNLYRVRKEEVKLLRVC